MLPLVQLDKNNYTGKRKYLFDDFHVMPVPDFFDELFKGKVIGGNCPGL